MKVGVKIMPRLEVLDSAGRAVSETLALHGSKGVEVRMGKFVELELPATDQNEAKKMAEKIAESTLCNPLIETFELVVL